MKFRNFPCVAAVALATSLNSTGPAAGHETVCRQGASLLPPPATDKPGRKYMRDRLAQIQHLKLDVTPDFAKRTIRGTATLTFKPIAKPLPKLELDAVGLTHRGSHGAGRDPEGARGDGREAGAAFAIRRWRRARRPA